MNYLHDLPADARERLDALLAARVPTRKYEASRRKVRADNWERHQRERREREPI